MIPEQSTAVAPDWKRLDGVDVLRSVAILFVLLNHVHIRLWLARIPYAQALPQGLVSALVWNGQQGVQIFFAVSGFLITSTSLRRWGALSRVAVGDFYKIRFARIAPLLLGVLAVLCGLHFAHLPDFAIKQETGGIGRALLAALTFRINVLEARKGYLPGNWDVLWSLSVEEMFYLFFPWIARVLGGGRLFTAVLCGFIVLGPVGRTAFARGNEIWHEYSYLGSMDAIALGCLTALLVSRFRFSRPALWIMGALGFVTINACLWFPLRLGAWNAESWGLDMSFLAIGTCMVIVAAAQTRWRAPGILKPILTLGQCSYEVYLTHMFIVFAAFDFFLSIGKPLRLAPVLFVVVIPLAGILGAMVSRFYSEPMNRLLRRRLLRHPERLGSAVDAKLEVRSLS